MTQLNIGILHPGDMGASVAAAAREAGHRAWWASEGRSEATRARAEKLGLHDAGSVAALCRACEVVVSVCPPHAAEDVAATVSGLGFGGLYLDANAISPQKSARIGAMLAHSGAGYVDGGVIGPPAWKPGTTRLYVSGPRADEIVACFTPSALETCALDARVGSASALKMCYAALTKGTTALLADILALADVLGVSGALNAQWESDEAGSAAAAAKRARAVTAKAWRFAGEMDEIAATFDAANLPSGFHLASAEVYRRLSGFKGAPTLPALDEVIRALIESGSR